jgi:hypothetical protein
MLEEKKILLQLVESFIDNGCTNNFLQTSNLKSFKSTLKLDDFNCFTICDQEHSIKCIFDKGFLKKYLDQLPSYTQLDNFEGCTILIKNFYFDLLFNKLINTTLTVKVVLYIQEFEVDTMANRMTTIQKDINTHYKVNQKLRRFFYSYTINDIAKNYNVDKLDALNFKMKDVPEDYSSFHNIIQQDNWLLNTQIRVNDGFYIYEACNFDNTRKVESNKESVSINDIGKVNFKDVFIKPPSDFLNRKRGRSEVKNDVRIPEKLKKVVEGLKSRKFTLADYNKYKLFKDYGDISCQIHI